MRLVERAEEHFTEGEPDLEPPEELALGELDDEQLLEEELDNDDISEEEVDEVTLELTLENLVHQSDPDDEDESGEILISPGPLLAEAMSSQPDSDLDDVEVADLEVADIEDVEESLDHILAERLAGDEAAPEDEELDEESHTALHVHVRDEFVCEACHLVRCRAQLSNPATLLCTDCAS
ncbi:MAG: hypothetical protein ACRDV4_06265 [Acidimicrobiales bacterium]